MNRQPKVWLHSAAAVIVLISYLPFFKALFQLSATDFYARHVVFVPVFAAGLLWIERHRFRGLTGGGGPGGPGLTAVALALLGFAYATANVSLQALSFVAAAAGLALWFHGVRGVRRAGFVLAFLLLMVPPPRDVVAAIAPSIQHAVAVFSGLVLGALQIPVQQHGVFLRLPGLTLQVAEACAGLRFSFILFVLVAAFARVVLPSRSAQLVLALLSVPVVMIANAMRVTAISLGAHVIGPHVATGALHDYIGKSFWVLAMLAMIGLAVVLRSRTAGLVAGGRSRLGPSMAGAS